MISCTVWWTDDDSGRERFIPDVALPALPRIDDVLNLEHLPDEAFEFAFAGGSDPAGGPCGEVRDVNRLVVRAIGIGQDIRVETSAPGEELCPHCGKAVA